MKSDKRQSQKLQTKPNQNSQYFIIFSTGKYRNDSLKISVKAVDTRSLTSGKIKGKLGAQKLLIAKSATDSKTFRPPRRFEM
jgi:hypothetical protein